MLEQALTVFVAQFLTIYMLGLQSQHIRDGKKVHSAITSLLLGLAGWFATGIVSTAYHQGLLSLVFFAFLCAGPIAIVLSITTHEHFHKEKK